MAQLFLALATQLLCAQSPPAKDPAFEITEKDAIAFARKFEAAFLEGKAETFDAAFDVEGWSDIAARGLGLTAPELKELRENFKKMRLGIGRKLASAPGGTYRFVGLRTVGPHRGPLFRIWSDEGLNYQVLILKKSTSGEIRVSDLFVLGLGDLISSLCRRTALAFVIEDPDRRLKLSPEEVESVVNMAEMRDFARLAREGRSQEALDLFKTLPESVRKDRAAQALRIGAAVQIGGEEYLKAAREFEKLFPDDRAIHLVTLDGFVHRKDFEGAVECLDRIDRSVGGDPLLHYLRGNMYLNLEKYPEAKKAGQQAVNDLPDMQEPRWLLVTVSLHEKAHAETVRLLTGLEKDFKLEMGDFESIEVYAAFVKSREYKDWMKSRAAK